MTRETLAAASHAVPQLQDALEDSAACDGARIALTCGERHHTYGDINAAADALAASLQAVGVARGDRVMIYADNTVETVIAFWAALKASAVAVVVNPLTKRDKLHYLLGDCRPTALVTDQHLHAQYAGPAAESVHLRTVIVAGVTDEARLTAVPRAVRFDDAIMAGRSRPRPVRQALDIDLAAIIYTSGSTGDAKGVMMTHRNMLTACASISSYLELRSDDVILGALPLAFDYGLYQMLMAFRAGARLVLERSFAFPVAVLNVMVREQVTVFPGVPTMFALLAEVRTLHDYDLSRLRVITNTAANLPERQIALLRALYPAARLYSMYGLTECKRCTYLPPADIDRKPCSVGIAIPNTELWLVDEHDQRVPRGSVGQLVIRGATVMAGYWEKPEATALRLRPGPLPGERVLYTGDLCRQDDEGYLYFVARMDDIIKSRGEKVAPKEVERALMNITGVREAAVIGVEDAVLGQAVKAFIVLEAEATLGEREIRHAIQSQLETFMVPKHIVFVESLPRTDSGKIHKTGLA